MSAVAIIPARGGSQRIPGKNIKPFAGRPIIEYSIACAIECSLFNRVIVSTDDERIARVAKQAGAEVPFMRPPECSGDDASTLSVIRHALEWLGQHGDPVELACCIYATAPFIQLRDIESAHALLIESGASFTFPVTPYAHPVQRSLRINEQGAVEPANEEHVSSRTQDLEVRYHDAGQFYWGLSEAWRNEENLFTAESLPVIIPRHRVHDIDTPEDWAYAELVYRALNHES